MSNAIKDGSSGQLAQVFSDEKLATRAITSTETQDAAVDGRAWNFNTGWISSVAADSALIYFKNDATDDADFFVDAVAVGLKDGSATDVQGLYFVKNPTGGTIIDNAADCDMIENRNLGSGKNLSSTTLVYKASASGKTITGGSDAALFAQNDQGRMFATVDFVIPKGKSCAVRLERLGSFSGDVYAAIIGHYRKVL